MQITLPPRGKQMNCSQAWHFWKHISFNSDCCSTVLGSTTAKALSAQSFNLDLGTTRRDLSTDLSACQYKTNNMSCGVFNCNNRLSKEQAPLPCPFLDLQEVGRSQLRRAALWLFRNLWVTPQRLYPTLSCICFHVCGSLLVLSLCEQNSDGCV